MWRPPAVQEPSTQVLAAIEGSAAWRCVARLPRLTVWTDRSGALPVRVLPRGGGVVLGDLLSSTGGPTHPCEDPSVAWEDPVRAARHLCAVGWGAYAVILLDPRGGAGLFRDPGGQLGAYAWTLRTGEVVIASDPVRTPAAVSPPRLAIDWERVRRFTAAPSAASDLPLLDGIQGACPGQIAWLHVPGVSPTTIWTPADFVSRDRRNPTPAEALVRRVDRAVSGLVGSHDRVVVEVSGGLDSAIVATAIAATGEAGRVAAWLNCVGAEREADERTYAAAVARRAGGELQTFARRARPLDLEEIEELALDVWPTMAAIEPDRDRAELDVVRRLGATAIVSGEGGDAAFYQMPSEAIFADALRDLGPRAFRSPLLANVARRTRRSVWGVLARARRRDLASPAGRVSPYVVDAPDVGAHPWVRAAEAADAPPGKRLQILALSTLHLHQADSRRRAAADMLFPLFSQPVMELCLSIPSYELAGEGYDRPLARRAFAGRLPPEVVARRGKGDHTVHYAHVVARNLDLLRPYLLEGTLCAAGVLDRPALEHALASERLIWGERPASILWATAVEAWARAWRRRVPDASPAPRGRASSGAHRGR